MPKAAVVTHLRTITGVQGFFTVMSLREGDRIYTVLPLYHTAGGTVASGLCLLHGLTMILRDKCDRFASVECMCWNRSSSLPRRVAHACPFACCVTSSATDLLLFYHLIFDSRICC